MKGASPAEALYGAEIGLGGDLPVNRHALDGQNGNHQRSNQGKGVAKQVDHRSLLFGLPRERAEGPVGNTRVVRFPDLDCPNAAPAGVTT